MHTVCDYISLLKDGYSALHNQIKMNHKHKHCVNCSYPYILSLLTFSLFFSVSYSDPRTTESALFCNTTTAATPKAPSPSPSSGATRVSIPTFVNEMHKLSQLISTHHLATYSIPNSPLSIYGLTQCYHDLSQTDCLLCYAAARIRLPRCLPSPSAALFLDGCFLRYDTYNFYNESVSNSLGRVNCGTETETEGMGFVRSVGYAVGNVTSVAVENNGFGVVNVRRVYALAQCWESVGIDGCRECLKKAGEAAKGCAPKREGKGMNAGCYLRYSTDKFYNDGREAGLDHHGRSGLPVIVAVALASVAFLMLSVFAAYAGYARLAKRKQGQKHLSLFAVSIHKPSPNFKYETLEKATDYFNPSRKIGQGGAGSVYMGTLPDGKTVAVKRLVFNTRQWVDEFFNEVNLISGIQHKNLVKLLGCSIEGPESLLVYDYVPNRSLDQFLFDKKGNQTLNCKQRYDIIVGAAEGLAYLHGGSQEKIIHRDIKSSNVLLDEIFTPKIADFGLVRSFGVDKTHLSTGIAGTIGYMAPEYLLRGQLTEKADVYSFGVLILEIVSGRRNNAFTEDSGSLLQTVWRLHLSGRLAEAVDPCLKGDFPTNEAARVLQIGLLCTQASVALRPYMAQVVTMLSNEDFEIPKPNQPPYMNASVLDPASSVRSYSTNSTNTATRVDGSYTSTGSSIVHSSDGPSKS